VNQQGKEFVVHLNRMKRAFKQGIWKGKKWERQQEAARKTAGAGGRASRNCIPSGNDPSTHRRQAAGTWNSTQKSAEMDTPSTASQSSESRELRIDPTFVPEETPVTRRELRTTRPHPPITRLQSRLHALEETAESDGE
jgi:hypothetical protein